MPRHPTAHALMDQFLAQQWGRGLLLEHVFLEVMTVLMVRLDPLVATRVGQILLDAQELDFVPCSDFFLETMEGFSTVLTFDEEFRKIEGVRVLPE